MKILICSDVHGSLNAGNTILQICKDFNIEKIFHMGDFNYNGARNEVPSDYNPKKLTEIYNLLSDMIVAVRGNCDSKVDSMVLSFPLPIIQCIKVDEMNFFLTHGDDESIFDFTPTQNETIVKGHTHIPMIIKNDLSGFIINPGSMTFPKGKIGKSFIIYCNNVFTLYEFENDDKTYKIIKKFDLFE